MAEDFKNQGNTHFKNKNYKKALECYSRAINANPSEPTYYTNRASAHIALEDYQSALIDCRKALTLNPEHPRALMRGARCLIVLGQLSEAKEIMSVADRVIQGDAGVKEEYKNLSSAIQDLNDYKLFLSQNNYSQALHYLEKLTEISTHCWEFKKNKIEAILMLGDLKRCEETIREYSSKHGNSPELVYLEGKLVYYKGDAKASEGLFKRCLSLDPDFSAAREMLNNIKHYEKAKEEANKLFSSKQNAEAVSAYSRCLEFDQFNKYYNSIILSNRSACYINLKEYIKALTDINKAIELNPEFVKAYVRRGNIRTHLEEYSEALKDYAKAKELSPGYPDIDNMISQAQQGSQNKKRKDYYKILEIEKGATDDQIKKAYRNMARKWHPDKNSATPEQRLEAEKMIKDVNEAYAVLSDRNKKNIYDSGGDPEGSGGMGGFSGMGGMDPSGIFQMFFGGGGEGGFPNMFSNMGNGQRVFMSSSGGMPGFMGGHGRGFGDDSDFSQGFGGFSGFPGFFQSGPAGRKRK